MEASATAGDLIIVIESAGFVPSIQGVGTIEAGGECPVRDAFLDRNRLIWIVIGMEQIREIDRQAGTRYRAKDERARPLVRTELYSAGHTSRFSTRFF